MNSPAQPTPYNAAVATTRGKWRVANSIDLFATRFATSGCDASADRAAHAGAAKAAITARIFRQILLVIILGEIERWRLPDLSRDRSHPLGVECLGIGRFRCFCGSALLR